MQHRLSRSTAALRRSNPCPKLAVTAEELATTPEATDIYLCSTAAKTTIEGLINTAFAAEGINVSLIRPSTLSGMIDNGIEMYMAGIGVQALKA